MQCDVTACATPPAGGRRNPAVWTCVECGKTYRSKDSLVSHTRNKHTAETAFSCDDCGRRYHSRSGLHAHQVALHGRPAHVYACPVCARRFSNRGALHRHTNVHTGERRFKCDTCGKAFAHAVTRLRHMATHGGEKTHVCTKCGKRFLQHTTLAQHERIHSGERPYVCTVCGAAFRQLSNLQGHQLQHPDMSERLFKDTTWKGLEMAKLEHLKHCTECDKTYSSNTALLAHKRACHLNTMQCEVCGKVLRSVGGHIGHMKRHFTSGDVKLELSDPTEASEVTRSRSTHAPARSRSALAPPDEPSTN